jgi:hypothetical protein
MVHVMASLCVQQAASGTGCNSVMQGGSMACMCLGSCQYVDDDGFTQVARS